MEYENDNIEHKRSDYIKYIDDNDFESFCQEEEFKSLTNLDLNNDAEIQKLHIGSIGDIGCKMIISACWFDSLIELDLSYNNIYNEGVQILANTAPKKLETLYLAGNKITDMGIKFIIDGELIKSLKNLDLGNNYIADNGVELLNDFSSNLISLHLRYNFISNKGIKFIANMIKNNKSLIHLSLDYNEKISENAINNINELLKINKTNCLPVSL